MAAVLGIWTFLVVFTLSLLTDTISFYHHFEQLVPNLLVSGVMAIAVEIAVVGIQIVEAINKIGEKAKSNKP